jgi:NADH dehydrogenase FAD-containing subunit
MAATKIVILGSGFAGIEVLIYRKNLLIIRMAVALILH